MQTNKQGGNMKTFFRPEMNVLENHSYSPSAGKPKQFLVYLQSQNIPLDIEDHFEPLTRLDLSLAHDQGMVDGILDLKRVNGFGNKSAEVARSLLYTSGSFYAAALCATKTKTNTFSPTSGFHHATFNSPGSFCTFNGLVVSALKLKEQGLVKSVGIVDCDQHYGNGTDNIIETLNLNWIKHYTFGGDSVTSSSANKWLLNFEAQLRKFEGVDIVFYQAGADPHINDPLGGTLTSEQMKQRDELVFSTFRTLGIPVVWDLAGGYQTPIDKVLEIHLTTVKTCLDIMK